jgi:lambda repressor-like predicted transcriptional regulator
VTLKNAVFRNVTPCGSCKNWHLGGNIATIIRMTRIGELGTMLAAVSNQSTLRRNTIARRFLSPWRWKQYIPPKRRFLQDPRGVTSQKTALFIYN